MNHNYTHRPLLVYHYERYQIDQNIGAYIRSVANSYTTGGLERLATSGERAARRGAVLALGRLADYRSNTTLGHSLVDQDRGVRILAETRHSATLDADWYNDSAAAFGSDPRTNR